MIQNKNVKFHLDTYSIYFQQKNNYINFQGPLCFSFPHSKITLETPSLNTRSTSKTRHKLTPAFIKYKRSHASYAGGELPSCLTGTT